VAGALPGELVAAIPASRRAGIVEGRVLDLLGPPHPAREAAPCRHAPRCGGCDWPHVEPERGAGLKVAAAAEALRSSPALAERLRSATIRTSPPAYRLRARLHWDPDRRTLGFYELRSRKVSTIPDCRVVSGRLAQAIRPLERPSPPAALWPSMSVARGLGGGRAVAGH
jgi:23S rRNA (uracil1939-C5)-methyltransferase